MKRSTVVAVFVALASSCVAISVRAADAPPHVIFEDSANELPQAQIRAAIEQELGPGPGEGEEAPRLSIAVAADGQLLVRYQAGAVTRERTIARPARPADVPVVLALIAGNLARDQGAPSPPVPSGPPKRANSGASPPFEKTEYPNEASTLDGSRFARFSARAELGAGWGAPLGLTLGMDAALEYWLEAGTAVGLAGGITAQGPLFGPSTSTWFVGPELALRSSPTGYGPFIGFIAGFGRQAHTVGASDPAGGGFLESDCAPFCAKTTYSAAAVGQVSLGVIAPLGHFQIGPIIDVQGILAREKEAQLTINLALGWTG